MALYVIFSIFLATLFPLFLAFALSGGKFRKFSYTKLNFPRFVQLIFTCATHFLTIKLMKFAKISTHRKKILFRFDTFNPISMKIKNVFMQKEKWDNNNPRFHICERKGLFCAQKFSLFALFVGERISRFLLCVLL